MKRKTRIRKEWFPKEEGFLCAKCSATGNCGDDRQDAIENNLAFYWDEHAGEHGKIVCLKCEHWLETKKELEKQISIKEIQQYGFWLRFMSEHFIPCDDLCQDELHKLFTLNSKLALEEKMTLDFCNPLCVSLYIYKVEIRDSLRFFFELNFASPTPTTNYRFVPCDNCQEKLRKLFLEKEFHIGNDVKPMIELWRKWELIED